MTVKYRGLTVLRQKDHSMIIFPDGQTTNVEDGGLQRISLEVPVKAPPPPPPPVEEKPRRRLRRERKPKPPKPAKAPPAG